MEGANQTSMEVSLVICSLVAYMEVQPDCGGTKILTSYWLLTMILIYLVGYDNYVLLVSSGFTRAVLNFRTRLRSTKLHNSSAHDNLEYH